MLCLLVFAYWFADLYLIFQRKQEKEIALYGRVLSSDEAGLENEDIGDDGEEINDESLSGEYMD